MMLLPAGVTRRPFGNVAENDDALSGPATPEVTGARSCACARQRLKPRRRAKGERATAAIAIRALQSNASRCLTDRNMTVPFSPAPTGGHPLEET